MKPSSTCLAWRGDQIRDFLGDGSRYGIEVTYSDEGPEALETGGGIRHALPLLGSDPFWIVNGDVYCDYAYSRRTLGTDVIGHLVLVPNPAHNPAGDFALHGDVAAQDGGKKWTYSGIAVLRPELVAGATPGKFPLAPLLIDAMRRRAITGELYRGRWVDVGTPERMRALDRELGAAAGP